LDIREQVQEIEKTRERILLGGGPDEIEKQHRQGKLTARDRVEKFVDSGSFAEHQTFVRPTMTGIEAIDKEVQRFRGDGIVAGYGKVNGRPLCLWAQDATVFGGRVGTMHGVRMTEITARALRARIPLVGMFDSQGMRVEDVITTPTNYSYDGLMQIQTSASGVIPQLSLVMGPCVGAAAFCAQLADFVFMVRRVSYAYVSPPPPGISLDEMGGAWMHAKSTGSCDVLCESDEDCLAKAKELLSFLPLNCWEKPPVLDTGDDPEREISELLDLIPTNTLKPYDMYQFISLIVDNGCFFEIKHYWATNLIIGFAHMSGHPVGIIANNPQSKGGCLDVDAADKEARFARFCDAFDIPLIWICETPAFLPAVEQEHKGIIRHGSKQVYANSETSAPMLTVYPRKAYGGGNLAMPGNMLGGDVGLAWPSARILLMDPQGAASIKYRREVEAAPDKEAELRRRTQEFKAASSTETVWEMITLQDYIRPEQTRAKLIKYLQFLLNKKKERAWRKHDNIQL